MSEPGDRGYVPPNEAHAEVDNVRYVFQCWCDQELDAVTRVRAFAHDVDFKGHFCFVAVSVVVL